MNLAQLDHLLALAETGSFSRAAERLHLTQSALSRSIQALEHELGLKLVDRIGRRNEITPSGRAIVDRARRVVFEASELVGSAALLKAGSAGAIRVGLGSGPGAVLMTPLLIEMAQRHPRVKVSISRGATQLQVQSLRARTLDALVIDERSLVPAADLLIESCPELRAGFICRGGHPLTRRARVGFESLLRYPIASTPLSDAVARVLVERYGPRAHPSQLVTLRCEEISSLLDAARATDAIFLGIVAAARAPIARGELVELPLAPPLASTARFALVTLAGRTEPPAMRVLRAFVAAQMHE